ncbi:MAG TPA: lysophospholipid acyltransferase family protein [Sphingobacterium sp.]|nr:lysophospholipid acyltransferase family protein [Sphingobacterium sp.]
MHKVFGYLLTPIFYIFFAASLLIFHPIQWVCLKWGGYRAHKKSVDILNGFLVACNYILFNRTLFIDNKNLPLDRPIIFVANHQSTYDIPAIIFFMRRFHGKFISKIELAKANIPSISFNLKHGGAANIDRKDARQSIIEITKLAENMKQHKWSAFIFPEGTRSTSGKIKKFKARGVTTLLKKVPDALLVPIVIQNSYKMVEYGMFPLRPFTKMSWEVLEPIQKGSKTYEEMIEEAENIIRAKLDRPV